MALAGEPRGRGTAQLCGACGWWPISQRRHCWRGSVNSWARCEGWAQRGRWSPRPAFYYVCHFGGTTSSLRASFLHTPGVASVEMEFTGRNQATDREAWCPGLENRQRSRQGGQLGGWGQTTAAARWHLSLAASLALEPWQNSRLDDGAWGTRASGHRQQEDE